MEPSSISAVAMQVGAPNHALQRTRPSRRGCNRGVPRAGTLSLGRSPITRTGTRTQPEGRYPYSKRRRHVRSGKTGRLPGQPGVHRLGVWALPIARGTRPPRPRSIAEGFPIDPPEHRRGERQGPLTRSVEIQSLRIALGSALECAAILDVLRVCGAMSGEAVMDGKRWLGRILSMLTGRTRGNGQVKEDGFEPSPCAALAEPWRGRQASTARG